MSEKTRTTWVINGLLAAILVLLAGYYLNQSSEPAYAAGGWETDGIMATTALDTERLVLIDTKNQAICVYKTTGNKFRLVGARSFEFDTEVEDSAVVGCPIEKGQGMTWMKMYEYYKEHTKKP